MESQYLATYLIGMVVTSFCTVVYAGYKWDGTGKDLLLSLFTAAIIGLGWPFFGTFYVGMLLKRSYQNRKN